MEKSSRRTGRHTSFGNRQGISANIQKPANVGRGTSRHKEFWKNSQTTLNPNKILYTNDICLILIHRNRAKRLTHI